MLKIQYLSDIHLELMRTPTSPQQIIVPDNAVDVLVLAGDIGNPFQDSYVQFLQYVASVFPKTFVIAGNHEFYNNGVDETIAKIREIVMKFETITFLHNSFEDYRGIRFVGTPLWTHIDQPQYKINDTNYIKNFTVKHHNKLHADARVFLREYITKEPCVVITHHVPLHELTHPQYKTGFLANYNQWFHCDLHSLMNSNIKAWFYGHTHMRSIQAHFGVTFYCNPRGYDCENPELGETVTCKVEF